MSRNTCIQRRVSRLAGKYVVGGLQQAARRFARLDRPTKALERRHAFGRRGTLVFGAAAAAGLLAWLARPAPLNDRVGARVDLARPGVSPSGPLAKALDAYKWDLGTYPGTDEGLAALLRSKSQVDDHKYNGPYVDKDAISDPWGTPYRYRFPGRLDQHRYDLWSCGPNKVDDDGRPGSDDITNARR